MEDKDVNNKWDWLEFCRIKENRNAYWLIYSYII